MPCKVPKKTKIAIQKEVFDEADRFGYMERSRYDSGSFLDRLVESPKVGKKLAEYMEQAHVRTYIKDAILNAYTKMKKKEALESIPPEKLIKDVYGDDASIIQEFGGKHKGMYVLRGKSGKFYILSPGTVLKWETALRKALQVVAQEPLGGETPRICLSLYNGEQPMTEPDRKLIIDSLAVVGVKATFCAKKK